MKSSWEWWQSITKASWSRSFYEPDAKWGSETSNKNDSNNNSIDMFLSNSQTDNSLSIKIGKLYGVFISNFAALITENGNKWNLLGAELGKTPKILRDVHYFSNTNSWDALF